MNTNPEKAKTFVARSSEKGLNLLSASECWESEKFRETPIDFVLFCFDNQTPFF